MTDWRDVGRRSLLPAGIVLLLIIGAVVALAVRPDDSPAPDVGAPFLLSGPLTAAQALSGENLAASSGFVLDVRTGEVTLILRNGDNSQEGDSFRPIGFLDDETLLVHATRGGQAQWYRAGLDGSIELTDETAAPTAFSGQTSASGNGDWLATESGGTAEIVVRPLGPGVQFRLTSAAYPQWAPQGDRFAFTGNICAGFDAFTFDPNTQELQNLTEALEPAVLGMVWRPDGGALAANVIPFGEERRILGLIDSESGAMTPLIDVPITGELSPGAWSPDGNRLTFVYVGGRGYCDSGPVTGGPTELEVIDG